jgi:glutamate N-acetyltransferase/amino-acid N-acetyltransferase
MAPVETGIPVLVESRLAGRDAANRAATAIMTTDTVCKEVLVRGAGFTVGGMAKGAAMLAPNMATMLAVLTTDARCEPDVLAGALRSAVEGTFNRMSVDGCTSTNDTVLVLASGASGVSAPVDALTEALAQACGELSGMMVADAEGATKVAHVVVTGAATHDEAHRAARKVAESALVKCSLNGEDPYWGRVVSELGSAGVAFDIDRVEVAYGGVVVCRQGIAAEHDAKAVHDHMTGRAIEMRCDLGLGEGTGAVFTTDLGYGYIDENRTTS